MQILMHNIYAQIAMKDLSRSDAADATDSARGVGLAGAKP